MAEKKPIKKRPPKTVKEKKFVKAYLETGNATKAALAAYSCKPSYANRVGSEVLSKLDIGHWLDKAGLTDEVIAQNTARIALTATKQNQYTGEIEPDNAVQLKGMEFAAKLKNLMAPQENASNTFFQFIQNQKNTYVSGD